MKISDEEHRRIGNISYERITQLRNKECKNCIVECLHNNKGNIDNIGCYIGLFFCSHKYNKQDIIRNLFDK